MFTRDLLCPQVAVLGCLRDESAPQAVQLGLDKTAQATPVGYPTGQPAPSLTPIAVGPAVSGTFDGTTLTLTSDEQKLNTNTGLSLTRQFRIVAKLQPGKGQVFEGEYRETMKGFQDANSVSDDRPLTTIGRVTLYLTLYLPHEDTPTPTPTQPNGPTSTADQHCDVSPAPGQRHVPAGYPRAVTRRLGANASER